MRIVLVEDDEGVSNAIAEFLRANGHAPTQLRFGADALTRHREADVILLDLGLPDADGLDVLRKLRRVTEVPVLILTARSDERSVVRGLRWGADDYLVKPVRAGEMLARIEAVSRRAVLREQPPPAEVRVADVRIDLDARRVYVAGAEVELTGKEFDLLAALAARRGSAVSRQRLMDEVWGDAYVAVSRSLDVHIAQLRAKIGRPELFVTIRGFGYRFGEE
ncbi:response regulator transcription factor [Marinitenerispora sediminis]|uniref:Sensory transduction protein RegX3 n=1 Tax=Marinitenerispora sediminis TaxID=1931232 RepID=A0A368T1M5_9ACTN|nr:response regulator transcription factor [Marinitenerispora sediminis]RCV49234.1 DNA-binding response regulator [Marinitenerispora sediminis]RCV49651.1 DNA-binding response regulator [Marinitenerispora sediminis]RCV54343.1 DNA-binding response regulator [Marinitenerispora sediminis]